MRHRNTPRRVRAIQLIQEGWRDPWIAPEVGLSRERIRQIRAESGFSPYGHRGPIFRRQRPAQTMSCRGPRCVTLLRPSGKKFYCSNQCRQDDAARTMPICHRAYHLRETGISWAEVAARVGCNHVSDAVRNAGYYAHRTGRAWPLPVDCRFGRRKLTDEQVVEIQRRYKAGGISQMGLAREAGCSIGLINRIVNGGYHK